MPPKTRITREMVMDAALKTIQESGAENVNARTVSETLGCSTQPVMYCFKTIEDMKRAVHEKLDCIHSEYLMHVDPSQEDMMLGIGLNYIRFAVEEPNLFRFLFQSGYAKESSLMEMVESEELKPLIAVMREGLDLTDQQTKDAFLLLSVFAHGYASIIANESLPFDEQTASEYLEKAYRGAIYAVQEEANEEAL